MPDQSPSPPNTPEPRASTDAAFDLLDRRLQRQLYAMKWPSLRQIQVQAIRAYLNTDQDILLMAETAAGKTEAAFLPILSSIADEPVGSVRAIYVGPLRALINDQFARIDNLCTYLELPVHRWHSDVGGTKKEALIKNPGGVLLITPESIESLLINRTPYLPALFGGLRVVVIDELHAFLSGERGLHLASLLSRVRRYRAQNLNPLRLIGLSATVGDPDIARRYLNPVDPQRVQVIRDDGRSAEILLRLHGYDASELASSSEDGQEEPTDLVTQAIARDLAEHCRGHSNLVFANAKGDIEIFADLANEECRRADLPECFLVHHGSLSRDVREDAEAEMKSGQPRTAICSSTLEMGIDIGSIRLVGQIGPPWSVASLKQRMGRSGRKPGEARRLRCYVDCTTEPEDANPLCLLPLDLLQAIAVCDLMLEGWVEPPAYREMDLSTLTHQVMSTIAELGAVTAVDLYQRLCLAGPFVIVSPSIFARLLQALGETDILEQGQDGKLILGLRGEKLRAGRDFYAAFATSVEYAVLAGNRMLGTLPVGTLPKQGDHIVFAARRWQVVGLDVRRCELYVQPATRRQRPKFLGSAGQVHHRVVDRMRDVLASEEPVPYLNAIASKTLAAARALAREHRLAERDQFTLNTETSLWMTWTGTAETRTYQALLSSVGVEARSELVGLVCGCSLGDLRAILHRWSNQQPDLGTIAEHIQPKRRRKFDQYISEDLLDDANASTLSWEPPFISSDRAV